MITPDDILRLVDATDLPVPGSQLQIDSPLVTQGLDSLDVATLMVEVESRYNRIISPEQMPRLRTVNDIVDFLNT